MQPTQTSFGLYGKAVQTSQCWQNTMLSASLHVVTVTISSIPPSACIQICGTHEEVDGSVGGARHRR